MLSYDANFRIKLRNSIEANCVEQKMLRLIEIYCAFPQ